MVILATASDEETLRIDSLEVEFKVTLAVQQGIVEINKVLKVGRLQQGHGYAEIEREPGFAHIHASV